jgi:tetratricopeptide (TPR) repeat protein
MPAADRRRVAAAILCLSLALLAAFGPMFGNGFTNWDDPEYVTENPDLLPGGSPLTGAFRPVAANWHPLTMLSLALDRRIFGDGATGHLAVNLALHLAALLGAFAAARLLTGSVTAALVVALLLGIHPLRVESVAWVSQRKDVLCAALYFGSLAAWLAWRRSGARGRYLAALALFALALGAKPMAVSLPLVLALADWYIGCGGRLRDRVRHLLPFLLLAGGMAAVTLRIQRSAGAYSLADGDVLDPRNLLVAAWGIIFYLVKTVAPVRLSALYPLPPGGMADLPWTYPAAPVAIAAGAFLLFLLRRHRTLLFGALFYLAALLPVLQLVRIGSAAAADRYSYIASFGLLLPFGVFLDEARRRLPGPLGWALPWVVLGSLAAMLIPVTRARTAVWHDSLTLWNDTVAKSPTSALAWNNRGNANAGAGRSGEAMADYRKALEIDPGFFRAWYNAGNLRLEQDDLVGAVAAYDRAALLAPRESIVPANRGIAHHRAGDLDRAEADYRLALAYGPPRAGVLTNLGLALQATGRPDEAEDAYRRALRLQPGHREAMLNLGILLAEMGRRSEAILLYRGALAIDPADFEAGYNLAVDLDALGRRSEAAEAARELVRRHPGSPQASGLAARISPAP